MSAAGQDELRSNLETIQRQQETIRQLLLEKYEPIAIVGVGLRFPGGSNSPAEFTEFLREGRSGIRPVPADRWDVAGLATGDPDAKGKIRMAGGGFLDRIDEFDAQFFNISPKEAPYVDPQQRMLLETAWEALEHANIDPTALRRGNGGVYVGASSIDYALELEGLPYEQLAGHLAAGITLFPLSGRLSYFLGWHGPSMTVDTACASSLTALHLAVEGLRRRECDIALCGAVNALHHPRVPVIFTHANMLSPEGQCKTFDDDADGYVRAEGCGALVLKRFSDARRDGDHILALVRGTAVGQDGESAGLTVPNGTAQEAVMRAAIASAMLQPADIQYVEAHGTGTPLGDPIEMGAISDVFAGSHSPDRPVVVGSVKTNLGHMEPVAGIVGVVKTVLQMGAGVIFPHLNFRNPSGRIPWRTAPVTVPTECRPWRAATRRALVNSFGFAGTISAAVLEEAPRPVPAPTTPPEPTIVPTVDTPHVFTLSAKTKRAMRLQVERYRGYLADRPDVDLGDLCYTSNVGRAHHGLRLAAAVDSREGLAAVLDKRLAALDEHGAHAGDLRKAAFLFAGQGSQYVGMGAALYRRFPVFRDHVDECDRLFAGHLGRSVRAMTLGAEPNAEEIHQTLYTQPALFTVEYALAKLWLSWGVRPNALIGHSIGEVVAAGIAGLFSLEDAVKLVSVRARLMQSVSAPGGMAAVGAAVDEVAPLLVGHDDLAIAAVNSPVQCVVSGGRDSLAAVVEVLRGRGLRVRDLAVSHAFHSPLMREVFDEFRAALRDIRFREPTLTLISNLTGAVARPAELADVEYWVRHIGEPVNFRAGMSAIQRRGRHVFIEIGPSAALTSLARQCVAADDHRWLRSMHPDDHDGRTVLTAAAQAYTAGLSLAWPNLHDGRPRHKVDLPTYAFDRKRYWLPVGPNRHGLGSRPADGTVCHPLLGAEVSTPEQRAAGVREFATTVTPARPEFLADHRASEHTVMPVAAHLEALLALTDAVYGHTRAAVRDVRAHEPLRLAENQSVELRTRLTPGPDGTAEVEIVSRVEGGQDGAGRRVATGTLTAATRDPATTRDPAEAAVAARTANEHTPGAPVRTAEADELYARLSEAGLELGPQLRRIRSLERHGETVVAQLRGASAGAIEHLPPALLESALHLANALTDGAPAAVPVSVGQLNLFRKPKSDRLRVVVRRAADTADADLTVDVVALEDDEPVFELLGVGLKAAADRLTGTRRDFFHELTWMSAVSGPQPAIRPRHILVLGRGDAEFAPVSDRLDHAGTRLSFPGSVDEVAAILRREPTTDVCWFWRTGDAAPDAGGLRAECERNYRELLDLLAVLADEGFGRNQRLWLVTERAQWLPGDAPGTGRGLAAATLWGFGHVLLNEHPAYRVTMLDLPDGEFAGGCLVDEWYAPDSGEFQVAFRAGERYVRRLLPRGVQAPGAAQLADLVRPEHTYLITGGLGALGLVTAEKLVDLGARHLALVGRRPVPAADLAQLYGRLARRATVTVYQGDIADPGDMARIAQALRAAPHPVGGIVHAAGLLDDRPVAGQTWESIDALFRSKVYGSWLLHEAAQGFPKLRFFVGFSSAASVVGGASQSNYAAANAFLDGLMHWRARQGLPGLAVNWGPWSEVGMSARLSAQHVRMLEAEGIRFFTPARALRALTALLLEPAPQVAVGECDWDRFVPAKPVANALYERLVVADDRQVTGLDLPALLAQRRPERIAAIEQLVRARVAGVLHLDDVDAVEPHVEFVRLGLDSLMAVELKNILEAALRIPLAASVAFDHPSSELLADFLDRQLVPEAADISAS
jgi:acyl transferase domain-containing protein/acyl carrier protein